MAKAGPAFAVCLISAARISPQATHTAKVEVVQEKPVPRLIDPLSFREHSLQLACWNPFKLAILIVLYGTAADWFETLTSSNACLPECSSRTNKMYLVLVCTAGLAPLPATTCGRACTVLVILN